MSHKSTNSEPQMYNDFVEDSKIPMNDRFQCKDCEQWVPVDFGVHTCYCIKAMRGEDVSKCKCAVHGDKLSIVLDAVKSTESTENVGVFAKDFNTISIKESKGEVVSLQYHWDIDIFDMMDIVQRLLLANGFHPESVKDGFLDKAQEYED